MTAALPTRAVEKPWGRDVLPAPFAAPKGSRIGEIWFEPPPALDQLLVKYIFTSQKLSVQVHPGDDQTRAAGVGQQGKEECWLVIAAEPDAVLGIGFRELVDAGTMQAAALDGSIEAMLDWHPVSAGDFFYIPAGTVHAIGAGVSLIEVQQNSDITYRLYDYGRPRELHLDDAIGVAQGQVFDARLHRKLPSHGNTQLVDGPHFRLDRTAGAPGSAVAASYGDRPLLAIPLEGEIRIAGEAIAPGGCGLAPSLASIAFAADGLCLIAQPCLD